MFRRVADTLIALSNIKNQKQLAEGREKRALPSKTTDCSF